LTGPRAHGISTKNAWRLSSSSEGSTTAAIASEEELRASTVESAWRDRGVNARLLVEQEVVQTSPRPCRRRLSQWRHERFRVVFLVRVQGRLFPERIEGLLRGASSIRTVPDEDSSFTTADYRSTIAGVRDDVL
jgi:hypothetical protein